jgi:hypothetical protein
VRRQRRDHRHPGHRTDARPGHRQDDRRGHRGHRAHPRGHPVGHPCSRSRRTWASSPGSDEACRERRHRDGGRPPRRTADARHRDVRPDHHGRPGHRERRGQREPRAADDERPCPAARRKDYCQDVPHQGDEHRGRRRGHRVPDEGRACRVAARQHREPGCAGQLRPGGAPERTDESPPQPDESQPGESRPDERRGPARPQAQPQRAAPEDGAQARRRGEPPGSPRDARPEQRVLRLRVQSERARLGPPARRVMPLRGLG